MNEQETSLPEWDFHFGLCSPDDSPIPKSKCGELLDTIINWAEKHGYGIGGGFGPFAELND